MNISKTNIKKSFDGVLILLVFSAIITFCANFFFSNKTIRTILSLETTICLVAAFYYYIFIRRINSEQNINWKDLTQIRYADWIFTTPMMLISLSYLLSMNSDTVVKFGTTASIVILNYIMLGFGYLGEMTNISHIWTMILGFIPFFIMFYLIYKNYVKNSTINMWIFSVYVIIWSFYGIVYLFPQEEKNLITNILDMIAKGIIGLLIVLYFLMKKYM